MHLAQDDTAGRRYVLLTEYDGSRFYGWQKQQALRTVQGELERALQRLIPRFNGAVYGCSRTDAGVHAAGHISHFDAQTTIPVNRLALALNSCLPGDLAVRAAVAVQPDFHARYDAQGKLYRYRIWNDSVRSPLLRNNTVHLPGPLSVTRMGQALPYLIGQHDFTAFCDSGGDTRQFMRTIQQLRLQKQGNLVQIDVRGDGFLYHMVRIIIGTLVLVGQAKIAPADISEIIKGRSRLNAGKTMPAAGLCLEQVFYKDLDFSARDSKDHKECEVDVQYALE